MKTKNPNARRLLESARIQSAIVDAIGTAVDELRQYVEYGKPETDYGKEWPEVYRTKIEQLHAWSEVAELFNQEWLANKCRVTAATYKGML